ncbi:conjugal transfer protein TraG N-terminal domain-containing protein, partial [Klebsiella pneumoniae]
MGSCAAPSAKGDDKFITTDYLQQCPQVYEVDNVPIGLAIPASLTTRVGNALIQSYEMVFALPDSVTYSKTGMLFGSNLVAKSTDFLSQNP